MTSSTVTLGEIAEFVNGAAFSEPDWSDSGMKIIRIQNLTNPTKPFNRTNRQMKDTIVVRPGDLLVSWSATLGVFEWRESENALLNQHIFRVIPDLRRVDKPYLRHLLGVAISGMGRHVHGATMKHINRAEFLGTSVPLPPLEEQRRIASILDAADALRTKRRQAIEKLDSLTQSIFIDMFGSGSSWSSVTGAVSLGELERSGALVLGRGKVISKLDISACPGDYPIYSSAGLNNGEFGRYGRYMFDEELITWSVDGGGHLFYRPRHKFSVTNVGGWIRVTDLQRINARYLHAALSHLHARLVFDWTQKAHTSVMRRVYSEVLIPPIHVQEQFAERAEQVDVLKSSLLAHQALHESLFASLQHQAFRGEL